MNEARETGGGPGGGKGGGVSDWRALHGDAYAGRAVVVSGGAGFIGSHLCQALVGLGAWVQVVDDMSSGSRENIAGLLDGGGGAGGGVELVEGSILDERDLESCMQGWGEGVVFHLAALGSVAESVREPARYHEVNATGTLRVLEAARDMGGARVVLASSAAVYGDVQALPVTEDLPVQPASPYAASKVSGEALVRAYASSVGLDGVSLRFFNIFGARQRADTQYAGAIAAFAKALRDGERPTVYGDGEQSRDFCHVHNVVHACLLAGRAEQALGGQALNVGSGARITINELVRQMARTLGRGEVEPRYGAERPGEVRHSQASIERARQVLGYEPVVDFERGLAATVD